MNGINTAKIDEIVERESRTKPFSGVVYIKVSGEVKFAKAYGYANRSDKLPNRLNTRFGMASGCKIFTAAAICQLAEKGLLTFDAPIRECLGTEFPRFSPDVTIGHLLTHTSGIPDYFDEAVMSDYGELWADKPMYAVRSPKDFLCMFRDKDMMFSPGERFHYNNAGFIILGLAVEHLSEMGFNEYVRANIFEPCGMTDSGYFPMDRLPERTALGYIDGEGGSWKTNIYSVPILGGPDGGAFTTAGDMAKFWDALLDYRLMGYGITELMIKKHIQDDGHLYYGYGVWIDGKGDGCRYFVQGSDPGVSFISVFSPKDAVQYSVISNTNHNIWAISGNILAMLRM